MQSPLCVRRSSALRPNRTLHSSRTATCPITCTSLREGQAEDSDCLRFIARGKQYAGYHYKAKVGHPLWQRYGYEHTLRNDEAALSVARYILENPIRAGLVTRIEDYPYSGSSVYSIEQILEAIQLRDKWYRRSG